MAFGLYAEAGEGCRSAFSWAVSWWDLLVFWKEPACSPVRWLEELGLAGRLARRGIIRHWAGGGEEAAKKVRISEPQGRAADKLLLPAPVPFPGPHKIPLDSRITFLSVLERWMLS